MIAAARCRRCIRTNTDPVDALKLALRVNVGFWGCWDWLAGRVVRSPRVWKLVGLVKPWAVRRRTWRRLSVSSILLLLGWLVWCQARIWFDQLTMMLLCLSSRDLGEVLLVAFGEVAVVVEASFEC